jgi:predicted NBD/HSP70 family sugar kinase
VASDTTVRTLRRSNRAFVLRYVLLAGQTTRAQVGEYCGLSVGSVTNVVSDLLCEGLIEEAGSRPSAGGRPIAVLSPRPAGAYLIGVDVGEEGVAAELFDLTLQRVDRQFARATTQLPSSPAGITSALKDAVGQLWERHPDKWAAVAGMGLGLPGIVSADADGQPTLFAQGLGWGPVRVADLVDLPSLVDLPVDADNGAMTLAAAENAFGAARGAERAVVALLGRGVGLGVIHEGRPLRGPHGSAAEWGHTRIALGGRRCSCGGRGCVEAYVGAPAILDRWRAAGGRPQGHGWNALGALLTAADAGDDVAVGVVEETLEILGVALANLVNLYDPERVVVGGWVGLRLMEQLAGRLDRTIRAEALERFGTDFTLHACAFGGDSVALGAALLPLERLLDAPLPRLHTAPPSPSTTFVPTSKEMS